VEDSRGGRSRGDRGQLGGERRRQHCRGGGRRRWLHEGL